MNKNFMESLPPVLLCSTVNLLNITLPLYSSHFLHHSFLPLTAAPLIHPDVSDASTGTHLGRLPILFGTGHGVILHVHGAGRGSISLVSPLNLLGWF